MVEFLQVQGRKGATATEIRHAIWEALGDDVPNSSIYSVLYGRLPEAKGNYKPLFERFLQDEIVRYRLIVQKQPKRHKR